MEATKPHTRVVSIHTPTETQLTLSAISVDNFIIRYHSSSLTHLSLKTLTIVRSEEIEQCHDQSAGTQKELSLADMSRCDNTILPGKNGSKSWDVVQSIHLGFVLPLKNDRIDHPE